MASTSQIVTGIVTFEMFDRMLKDLSKSMRSKEMDELKRAIPHIPEKDMLDFLIFLKTCHKRGISKVSELDKLELHERLLLAAEFFQAEKATRQDIENRKQGRNE